MWWCVAGVDAARLLSRRESVGAGMEVVPGNQLSPEQSRLTGN